MEKTFIMVKPDGVQRQLIGEILSRFERKGLQLAGAKLMQVSEQMAETHYAEHKGKPFFGELVEFITSGPVFAMVWEGKCSRDHKTADRKNEPERCTAGHNPR